MTMFLYPENNLTEVVQQLNEENSIFKIKKVDNTDLERASFGGFSVGVSGSEQLSYLRANSVTENRTLLVYTYMVYDKRTSMQVGFFTLRLIDNQFLNKTLFNGSIGIKLDYFLVNDEYRRSKEGLEIEKNAKIEIELFNQVIAPLVRTISDTTDAQILFVNMPKKYGMTKLFKKDLQFNSKLGAAPLVSVFGTGNAFSSYLYKHAKQ